MNIRMKRGMALVLMASLRQAARRRYSASERASRRQSLLKTAPRPGTWRSAPTGASPIWGSWRLRTLTAGS